MPEVLDFLDRLVGADTLSLSSMQLRGDAHSRAQILLKGADPMTQDEELLWPQLLPTHPYVSYLIGGPSRTSRVTDVVDLNEFERTDLYQLLLRPRGSRYQAALVLNKSPTSMLLLSLWRAGRDFSDHEVARLEAFRDVMAAAVAYHQAVEAAKVCDLLAGTTEQVTGREGLPLTTRQRQVAALIEAGMTNAQIARRLGISSRTVRKHVEDLFERTGSDTRTQVAVRWRLSALATEDESGRLE
jgi:DNA-binding CsgD family transcriptional regulator